MVYKHSYKYFLNIIFNIIGVITSNNRLVLKSTTKISEYSGLPEEIIKLAEHTVLLDSTRIVKLFFDGCQ